MIVYLVVEIMMDVLDKWQMKNIIYLIIIIIMIIPVANGIGLYGQYQYNKCLYGVNSPPDIITYEPSSLTIVYDINSNVTFNISYSDCENDTLTLEWYIDGVINTTNQNLSYTFNNEGIINITANISDTYDKTYLEWNINILLSTGNISDVLIIPKVVTIGNLIAIKANITALTKNLTDVSAYLNIDSDFDFMSLTPQNKSIGNIYTNNVTIATWYISTPTYKKKYDLNITYFQSNSTFQGENNQLIVTNQLNKMEIIIGLIILGTAFLFLFICLLIDKNEHPILKLFLMFATIFSILIGINYANSVASDNGASEAIITTLNSLYKLGLYFTIIFSSYVMLFYFYQVFIHFKQYGK